MEKDLQIDEVKQNLLYSVYSFPNAILPLFGGYFVDKFGTNICLFVFSGLLTVGQALFAIGLSSSSYPLMVTGRVVFGLGGESLSVTQSAIIAMWFQDKELALALGISLSVSRLGSVFNDNMSPFLYNHGGLAAAGWFGFFICLASMGAVIVLIIIERATSAQLEANQAASTEPLPVDPPVDFNDIFKLSRMYWLITASCLFVYTAILPFNVIAGKELQVRFGLELSVADALLGVPFIISAVASPFLGFAVDKLGKRAWLLLVSSAVLVFAHCMLGLTMTYPAVGLVFIGIAYSLYAAAIWPSIPYVVEKQLVGTAYGLTTAVQNCGLAFGPLIAAAIYTSTHDYTYVQAFFIALAWCGCIVGYWINVEDARNGDVLNMSHEKYEPAYEALINDSMRVNTI